MTADKEGGLEPVSRPEILRQIALVGAAVLAYFGIRNLTAASADVAFANAEALLRLEEALGIAVEHALQDAIAWSPALVTLANWVYIWAHWPVIFATGVALFVFRRDEFCTLRNAMFVSGAIGFLFFALFPVAPPRLLDLGLVDTVTEQSRSYRALQPPGLTNQYAALPSLHFGWNLLVGISLVRCSGILAVRVFGVVSPAAMALAVIATANHFVVDVVAGVVVVLVALAVVSITASRRAATLGEGADAQLGELSAGAAHATVRRRAPRRQLARPPARRRGAWHRAHRGRRPARP